MRPSSGRRDRPRPEWDRPWVKAIRSCDGVLKRPNRQQWVTRNDTRLRLATMSSCPVEWRPKPL